MLTVSPEDLIDVVIAADALRRRELGMAPVRFRPRQRIVTEPFFNALGLLWGRLMRALPWSLRRPLDLWLCQKLAGHPPEPNPELPLRRAQAVALAKRLKAEHGQWPAVLILTSHPGTMGELAWLRFELLRQGIEIADALVEAHSPGRLFREHARCFLAIDPYALDTVSPAVGGFYAAWMHHTYLAWDRQPSTQSWIQRRVFLRNSGYAQIGWRLLRALKRDVPILMALPGGLPHNARLLYGAREFIQKLPLNYWKSPKVVVAKDFMELLKNPSEKIRPAENGELPSLLRARIRAFLEGLGLHGPALDALFNDFVTEFRQPIPNRERLFRILRARLTRKGKPVLLIAIQHSDTAPHVRISEPCSLAAVSGHFVAERFTD